MANNGKKPKVYEVALDEVKQLSNNPNDGTQRGDYMLEESMQQGGVGRGILLADDGTILAGNHSTQKYAELFEQGKIVVVETDGDTLVANKRRDIPNADDPRAKKLIIADNRANEVGLSWSPEELQRINDDPDIDLSGWFYDNELDEIFAELDADEPPEDVGAQVDRAAELQEVWQTARGQVWIIPSKTVSGKSHRVMCGDSTSAEDVAVLMSGEKAALCFADPPYGMGKEKDGIANDNLYREKLDAFQLIWWGAFRSHLEDNASAYIWGNAEDLWRFWYCGGLRDSERLTMRNEIVWNKGDSGVGKVSLQGYGGLRSYAPGSERCLFFMLGEQGFNNNADNYWEGWEPVRAYLAEQVKRTGWTQQDIVKITGVGMFSHWFTKSQFVLITKEHYEKLQKAARDYDAFKRDYDDIKRDYDDIKREFYLTRAYFDNTHDLMTDVWDFGRVQGEERHDHATPKPVELVRRAVKSSSMEFALIADPFLGSGTTAIAAEQTGRICYGMEISEAYTAVILQRLTDLGLEPVLHNQVNDVNA